MLFTIDVLFYLDKLILTLAFLKVKKKKVQEGQTYSHKKWMKSTQEKKLIRGRYVTDL